MGDEKKPHGSIDNTFRGNDPRTVDIDSPAERAFWCKALLTTEANLLAAVKAVGASAQRVKEYLQANRDLP
jgi:hypothetical protein